MSQSGRFRGRTRPLDAIRVDRLMPSPESWDRLPAWVREEYEAGHIFYGHQRVLVVDAEGRRVTLELDGWLVRQGDGMFFSVPYAEFERQFEPVPEHEQR